MIGETSGKDHSSQYTFHDLFSVFANQSNLSDILSRELSVFRKPGDLADLRVEEHEPSLPSHRLSQTYAFDDHRFAVRTPFGNLEIAKDLIRAGPRIPGEYLLTQWIENLVRHAALEQGVALIHASAVAKKGVGYLFPAWAHTGKTNVALTFLNAGYDYMADDWCFISDTSELLAYPRYLRLFAYNFDAHPNLVTRLRRQPRAGSIRDRLAATRFARSLDPHGPISRGVRRFLLKRYFVYLRVPVDEAVPGCRVKLRAPLSHVCFLQRESTDDVRMEEVSPDELVRRIVSCNRFERKPFSNHLDAMSFAGHTKIVPLSSSSGERREEEILTQALDDSKCWSVSLPLDAGNDELTSILDAIEGA